MFFADILLLLLQAICRFGQQSKCFSTSVGGNCDNDDDDDDDDVDADTDDED